MVKPILIIDPGHGGKDPGGGTNKYWKEKDKVLEISLYQYNRYKKLGIPVAITRTTDKYLSSAQRTKIVRNSGATYCHSNHINAGGGQGAEFIHSFYVDGKIEEIMSKEIKAVGQNVRRIFKRTYVSGGKTYDYYFMHRETGNVNTTIIEYGFADNSTDTKRINDNWKKYAEAIVKAFCIQIGHKYVAPNQPKPKPDPKPKPKEDDEEMLDKAIVINSFADFPVAELVSNKHDAPIYMRRTAEKQEVAKEVIVVGGDKKGIKGNKFTILAGSNRLETAAEVNKYLKK